MAPLALYGGWRPSAKRTVEVLSGLDALGVAPGEPFADRAENWIPPGTYFEIQANVIDVENHHDGYVVRGKIIPLGARMDPGTCLTSPAQNDNPSDPKFVPPGRWTLTMQKDGNLALWERGFGWDDAKGGFALPGGRLLWQSGTAGHPGGYAEMNADGNFVVRDANGNGLWWTSTANKNTAFFALQSNNNLVVYDKNGNATWAKDHNPQSGGFFSVMLDVAKAIPMIATAPLWAGPAAIASVGYGIATGNNVTQLFGDVAEWGATHPLEVAALTAGGAALAFGAPAIAAAVAGTGVAGAVGGAVLSTGLGVATAAAKNALAPGTTPPPGVALPTGQTPATQPVVVVQPGTTGAGPTPGYPQPVTASVFGVSTPVLIIGSIVALTVVTAALASRNRVGRRAVERVAGLAGPPPRRRRRPARRRRRSGTRS